MAELTSGAVTTLLGLIRDETLLLSGVRGDVQFIRQDGASRRRARRAGPRLDEPGPAPRAGLQQLHHHLPVLRRPRHPPRPGRPPALHLVASLVRERRRTCGALIYPPVRRRAGLRSRRGTARRSGDSQPPRRSAGSRSGPSRWVARGRPRTPDGGCRVGGAGGGQVARRRRGCTPGRLRCAWEELGAWDESRA